MATAVTEADTDHMHYIYLFGVLHCFQYCTGHVMMGSFVGRGNQTPDSRTILSSLMPLFHQRTKPRSCLRPLIVESR